MKNRRLNALLPRGKQLSCRTLLWSLLLAMLLPVISANAQQSKLSLKLKDTRLEDVFKEIEKQTGYVFFYNNDVVDVNRKVSINVQNADLSSVLNTVLSGSNITFHLSDKHIVLSSGAVKNGQTETSTAVGTGVPTAATQHVATNSSQAPQAQAQGIRVSGVVTTAEDGAPASYVSVLVKGKQTHTIADDNGRYTITVNSADDVLVFSQIGLTAHEEPVGSRNVINVAMKPEYNVLTEAVATGYQTISKERVTGSYAIVGGEVLNNQISYSLANSLEGKVPGLVKTGDGDLTIRGISTISAVASPLYVIDGFPVEGDAPQFKSSSEGSKLNYITYAPPVINPEEVESVTVLKDAAAASIYGSRAANGVVVIVTKKAKQGAAQINFSANLSIKPVYDFDKLNYMSANDLIDYQYDFIGRYPRIQDPATRASEIATYRTDNKVSPTMDLLLQVYEGKLTQSEADEKIDAYRSFGTPITGDYAKYIYRPVVTQKYYLSVAKAVEGANIFGSVTYTDKKKEYKNFGEKNLEINLRTSMNITKWLDVELTSNLLFRNNDNPMKDAFYPLPEYISNDMPYTRLVDSIGNPQVIPFTFNKSHYDVLQKYPNDLLNLDMVMQDELNRNMETIQSLRTRAAAKVNAKLTGWLKFSTSFQYEVDNAQADVLYNKESFPMRLQYDDFSYLNTGGTMEHRLPYGDSYSTNNGSISNFTWRNQLNFSYTTENKLHSFVALAGTETRETTGKSVYSRVWGYNSELLTYTPVNNSDLATSPNSSILGRGSMNIPAEGFFNQMESLERFVSLYGNGQYTFNNRFDLTGSIRWDMSNLFGTNPDHQYKALWSTGVAWTLTQEEFMKDVKWVDRLKVRFTYGINGNISKLVSPYLMADYSLSNVNGLVMGVISSPPNENLRWEKTATYNMGVDFSLFKNKLSGSIDYYRKNSTDLLAPNNIDPTLGFASMMVNMGDMVNQGIEVGLNGVLLKSKDFQWTAGLTFAYNKNEVTKLNYDPKTAIELYMNSRLQKGYPYSSLYSYRFARIDDKGETVLYDENGKETSLKNVTNIKAVEYSGTTIPPYSGSLYSTLSYKGFDLSFNFIFNAGHVMRKQVAEPNMGAPSKMKVDGYANSWTKAGDELLPGVTPRITYVYDANITQRNTHWRYNSSQIVSASYVKLRSLSLGYTVPSKVLKGTFIKSIHLQAQVDNLFFIAANKDGIDPETYGISLTQSVYDAKLYNMNSGNLRYPIMPTYSFGLNLSF